MARTTLNGLDDILKNMESMRVGTKNKQIRKALRKALIPIRDQVKENAKKIDDPETAEKIWRNVQIQSGKSTNKGEIKASVGIKGGAKKKGDKARGVGGDTWYFRLIEYGTRFSPAIPFLRPAFEAKKTDAERIFTEEFRKGILEEIKK